MAKKTYTNDKVTFGFNGGGKWKFSVEKFDLLVKCNSKETADKVANIVNGSFKRKGALDNLARANISQVTTK